ARRLSRHRGRRADRAAAGLGRSEGPARLPHGRRRHRRLAALAGTARRDLPAERALGLMGIDVHGATFLAYAKAQGVDFGRTLTTGRQGLSAAPAELRRILARFGAPASEAEAAAICAGADGYAEPLLERLGAREAHALDVSDFEGATHLHDLNQP